MSRKECSKYTIMVVPHSQKPPVSFKFPLLLLQVLGLALIFVPVLLVSFFNSYTTAQAVLPELHDLRTENQIKSEQIEELASETQRMLENLQRLQDLEKQLLEITDIDDMSQLPDELDLAEETRNFRSNLVSRSYTTVDRANYGIQVLQSSLPDQEDRMSNLKETIEEQLRREAAIPSRWPTWGFISSPFGWRRHPISRAQDFHTGIDIAGRNINGSPVYATGNGRVQFAGFRSSYGYLVIVDHGYGYTTYYAHLSRLRVQTGQAVTGGTVVGNVGSTGVSTGPHLHYEVRRWGNPINPMNYLP